MKIKTKLKLINNNNTFVAFLNVLFLLLIFLMFSNSFVQISAIPVVLPKLKGSNITVEKIIVTIDRYGNYYLNDQRMDEVGLKQNLSKLLGNYKFKNIILRVDKDTPQHFVTYILSLANDLGLNIYIAVDSRTEEKIVPFEKQ